MRQGFRSRSVDVFLITASYFIFAGCASGARVQEMTIESLSIVPNEKLRQSIAIESVRGGTETFPLLESNISNGNFRKALSRSLQNSGFETIRGAQPQYLLSVQLWVSDPQLSNDINVRTYASYVLVERSSNRVVMNEKVAAAHTTSTDESFYAPARRRLANEGSAKRNIEKFLIALDVLNPDKAGAPSR